MKFNPDCVRDILISIESMEYNGVLTVDMLHEQHPKYTPEVLSYHCLKLYEAGFVDCSVINTTGYRIKQVSRINDLTYNGHQFLAEIRSDNIWNKTKETAKAIGVLSVQSLASIATELVKSAIQSRFGL